MTGETIENISAYEVLDSRGNPTVEALVRLTDGTCEAGMVPSGASTGIREAVELRDGDGSRYLGKGVRQAVEHVNVEIAEALTGMSPFRQREIDSVMIELDGTDSKSRLGANAMLAVSLAVARAAAAAAGAALFRNLSGADDRCRMPVPYFNIVNGGAHANNSIDFQEFMIVPNSADSFAEGLRHGVEVYHHLSRLLDAGGHSTAVGDEGGFAPNLGSNEEALRLIEAAIRQAGFEPGKDICVALDVASSELHSDGRYELKSENLSLTSAELVDYLERIVDRHPIISIEDGMHEQDWDGWAALTERLGERVQVIGDDLFVTNAELLRKGVAERAANAILIKLNQIGTLTETLDTVTVAQEAGFGVMISHRSGETEDTTIADLAVATGAGQIKTGAPCRSERVAKYNRLLRIERQLEIS